MKGSRSPLLDATDWEPVLAALDANGVALCGPLLDPAQCARLADLYGREDRFRSRVVMARHGFGSGEYRYFDYPLPPLVQLLRRNVYPRLVALANAWSERMGLPARFPGTLDDMLERCRAHGQARPTPLLLKYAAGDYNCLHQDLYGEQVFPIQLTVLLSAPGRDFQGGEFVVTEQRPRMQSRVEVVPARQGDGILFAVNERPRRGSRGYHRVRMRHGVSTVRCGERYSLGVIFHDAA